MSRDPLAGNTGEYMDLANLSTKRQWIADLARRKPGEVLFSLHHSSIWNGCRKPTR